MTASSNFGHEVLVENTIRLLKPRLYGPNFSYVGVQNKGDKGAITPEFARLFAVRHCMQTLLWTDDGQTTHISDASVVDIHTSGGSRISS